MSNEHDDNVARDSDGFWVLKPKEGSEAERWIEAHKHKQEEQQQQQEQEQEQEQQETPAQSPYVVVKDHHHKKKRKRWRNLSKFHGNMMEALQVLS